MTALNLLLSGAGGRMGNAIRNLAESEPDLRIVGTHGRDAAPARPADLHGPLVLIDFTSPDGARAALHAAVALGVPFVCGTTGTDDAFDAQLDEAATAIPVLHAANMSLGVTVLRALVELAARALPDFDAEIVELHHGRKKDAPSGTALALLASLNAGRGRGPAAGARFGREGITGARTRDEIGVLAVRGGDVVGEHTVFLFGEGERIELVHRATDRAIFARGAVHAARWIAERPAGRYTMRDVVGG